MNEQLKELGLSLSSPIVDEMAVSGRMLQDIPLKHKLERVEKIEDNLRKIGCFQRRNRSCLFHDIRAGRQRSYKESAAKPSEL